MYIYICMCVYVYIYIYLIGLAEHAVQLDVNVVLVYVFTN